MKLTRLSFAQGEKPVYYANVTFPVTPIDRFTDGILARLDSIDHEMHQQKLRGHCQDAACYKLAEVTDLKTSLSYCRPHWARSNQPDWRAFELYRNDAWR